MKSFFFSFIFLALIVSTLNAQSAIAGTWKIEMDKNEGYDHEFLILTEDGYYYSILHYLNGAEYGIDPTISLGIYEFDGSTLRIYDMINDSNNSFTISDLDESGFLVSGKEGDPGHYVYQGPAYLTENQENDVLSWENYRKLGGNWQSEESVLKVLPFLGVAIIRSTTDPDFFLWGHYSIDGNGITLKEISVDESVFYTGEFIQFDQEGFTLLSDDEEEYFQAMGPLDLNETETMMVTRYMNMTHRTNMSIIDLMDGQQDYIWKRVDEYGNERH